ncbi:MAG: YafY family transcriptional regulator [Flavobacteriia bacterium]|nr:YafY family transcriptional regulator [Flavobacteriia bacterium]
MNRINRISAILIQLQSKKVVKAQEIADRFQISLRTVYRDINSLEEAGIPLYAEAGVGYSLVDGYKLPPVMFTREEALTFVTAEKLIEKFTDKQTFKHYQTGLTKLKAVLQTSEKEYINQIDKHLIVQKSERYHPPHFDSNTNVIQIILENITKNKCIKIQYNANYNLQQTERIIESIGVYFSSNHWYLIAFCHLRNEYRTFRVDRIQTLEGINLNYTKNHPSLENYLNSLLKEEKDLFEVIIEVEKNCIMYLGEQKYYNGFIHQIEKENVVEMHFLSSSIEGFARWYLMFVDKAQIITPPALKSRIIEIVSKIDFKL